MPTRDYAIARVRGLHGRLLGARGVLELLAQPHLAARLEMLRRSDYGAALPPGALSVRDAARALRGQLERDRRRITSLFDDARARALLDALFALEDVASLKTIVRGVARGEQTARVLALVTPGPDLDEGALKELAAQRDVKGVIDLLATWRSPFAAPLAAGLADYRKDHDLGVLEAALDAFALARAGAAAQKHGAAIAGLVRRMADPAGPAGLDPFQRDWLRQRLLAQAAWRLTRLEPLSLAVPVAYLLERREEVRRIRLVLEATELGLPADDLLSLLEPEAVA